MLKIICKVLGHNYSHRIFRYIWKSDYFSNDGKYDLSGSYVDCRHLCGRCGYENTYDLIPLQWAQTQFGVPEIDKPIPNGIGLKLTLQ